MLSQRSCLCVHSKDIVRFLIANPRLADSSTPASNLQLRGSLYQLIVQHYSGILKEARLHDLETLMFLIASLNDDNTRNATSCSRSRKPSPLPLSHFAALRWTQNCGPTLRAILVTTVSAYAKKKASP